MSSGIPKSLIKQALLIRRFEELLFSLYAEGMIHGTVHTCIGQEWTGVSLASVTTSDDFFVSNHRGHGHFLARTNDVKGLLAEIMGKATGVCGGIGGTQHLKAKNYFSSGIQGGMVPIAVGAAYARKYRCDGHISIACIGDGTLGEGIIYESMNIAARWEVPLLIVVENNRYAQSNSQAENFAGDIEKRAHGFGLKYRRGNTWNPENLLEVVKDAVSTVRSEALPLLLEIETDRLKAHSKGDDNRPMKLIEELVARDVISNWLLEPSDEIETLLAEIDSELAAAIEFCKKQPNCTFKPLPLTQEIECAWTTQPTFSAKRNVDLLAESLQSLFSDYTRLFMIGEDIEAPYGGAFKVTKDLSLKHLGRVRNTPISEAAIIGVGVGLALSGIKPLVEIMFGDFLTLCFDQLHQHAAKFTQMYGEAVAVPLIIRAPMGGRRGYGPTHSQSIEKHFLGIPGLQIIAINERVNPHSILSELVTNSVVPTLFIENKVLYTRPLVSEVLPGFESFISDERLPTVRISPSIPVKPDVTILCYGGMLTECEKALEELFFAHEIVAEIICPSKIAPLNITPILNSVRETKRLVTVEEGCGIAGFGSEVLSSLLEKGIVCSFRRVHYEGIIPSAYLRENELLPNAGLVCLAAVEIVCHE